MSTGRRDPSDDPVRSLLRASHHLRADQMGTVVAEHARDLGARDAVIYLADYEQKDLVPVPGDGVPPRGVLRIDGSVGGLAFRRVEVTSSPGHADGVTRLWVPLLDGAERMGVLELRLRPARDGSDRGGVPLPGLAGRRARGDPGRLQRRALPAAPQPAHVRWQPRCSGNCCPR